MMIIGRKSFVASSMMSMMAASLLASAAVAADGTTVQFKDKTVNVADIGGEKFPERVYDQNSFWYQKLPNDTPKAANSDAIVKDLVSTAEKHYGSPGNPNVTVNNTQYSPTMYVADKNDPEYTFKFDNCQNKPLHWGNGGDSFLVRDHLTKINIPAEAVPALGTDQEMVIYNKDTDTVTETWKTKKNADGTWSACWGGSIKGASSDDGVHTSPFGVTAAGLPMTGGTILAEELAKGEINHVIGIALPYALPGAISSPATRTDAVNFNNLNVPAQGQMMRIPADVDIDSLGLSPTARTIAKAAQDYGVIVWDTAGAVSFRAQNPLGLQENPYPTLFENKYNWEFMRKFPLSKFEVLPMNYKAPLNNVLVKEEPVVPTPEPTVAPTPTPEPTVVPAPTPEPTSPPKVEPTPTPEPTQTVPETPVQPPLAGTVKKGDLVWFDVDKDGRQDSGEPGIAGVRVIAKGPDGKEYETTTDSEGKFMFELPKLDTGKTYNVRVDKNSPKLVGASATSQYKAPVDKDSSSWIEWTRGDSDDLTLDFGFVNVGSFVTKGDFVWLDTNRNGSQDAGEPGIPGVKVSIVGDGVSQSTTTDANGKYSFTVPTQPGKSYTIQVDKSSASLSKLTPTKPYVGGSARNSSTWLDGTKGDTNDATVDFGFVTK